MSNPNTMKIALLDYINARVIVRECGDDSEDTALAIAEENGISLDDCHWMTGQLTIDIK